MLLFRRMTIQLLDRRGDVIAEEPFFGTETEGRAAAAHLLETSGASVFGVLVRPA